MDIDGTQDLLSGNGKYRNCDYTKNNNIFMNNSLLSLITKTKVKASLVVSDEWFWLVLPSFYQYC